MLTKRVMQQQTCDDFIVVLESKQDIYLDCRYIYRYLCPVCIYCDIYYRYLLWISTVGGGCGDTGELWRPRAVTRHPHQPQCCAPGVRGQLSQPGCSQESPIVTSMYIFYISDGCLNRILPLLSGGLKIFPNSTGHHSRFEDISM